MRPLLDRGSAPHDLRPDERTLLELSRVRRRIVAAELQAATLLCMKGLAVEVDRWTIQTTAAGRKALG